MRSGCPTGAVLGADDIAWFDFLAHFDPDGLQMGVDGSEIIAVIDDDVLAKTPRDLTRVNNGSGHERGDEVAFFAFGIGNVNAGMEKLPAARFAELEGNDSRHRPDEGAFDGFVDAAVKRV